MSKKYLMVKTIAPTTYLVMMMAVFHLFGWFKPFASNVVAWALISGSLMVIALAFVVDIFSGRLKL